MYTHVCLCLVEGPEIDHVTTEDFHILIFRLFLQEQLQYVTNIFDQNTKRSAL